MTGGDERSSFTRDGDHMVSGNRVLSENADRTVSGYAVIPGGAEQAKWSFTMPPGTELKSNEGGGVSLLITEGAESSGADMPESATIEVRDFIEAPWAIDRDGDVVPTHYVVQGNTVTQVLDRGDNDSEVVADPKLTFGFGVYLSMWGWEANAFRSALLATGAASWWTICEVANRVGGWGWVVGMICRAAPGLTVLTLINILRLPPQWHANWCYQTRILPSSGTMYPVNHVGHCD
ncbi:hypothetical protein G6009_15330 [Dietzia sp. SLG510A3-30A2]|jgi:hypothetical protein|nr:hypothetical protein [Dietzia sp. SLG510A3-30A2]